MKILYDGINIEDDLNAVKKKINLIAGGEKGLYYRLTGRENLEYFASLYGMKDKQRIDELLSIVNLLDAADKPVEQYSKGMNQRLKIAKGLLNDPQYLFLDEPTLGLDIVIAHEFRKYIHSLASVHKKGVVLTTHYIAEAEELCDYIYLIDKGKVVTQGSPAEIKEGYSGIFEYLVKANDLSSKKELMTSELQCEIKEVENGYWKIVTHKDAFHDILKACMHHNIEVEEIKKEETTLETALYKLLKKEGNDEQ